VSHAVNNPTSLPTPVITPVRKRIGEILVESGCVTPIIVEEALSEAKRTGEQLGYVLVRLGHISREQLGQALSQQFKTKYISLTNLDIPKHLLDLLPEEFMFEKRLVPVGKEAGRLVVAMVDPSDRSAIDEMTFITGMRPQAMVTTHIEFNELCNRLLRGRNTVNLQDDIAAMAGGSQLEGADLLRQQRDAEMQDQSNPLVKLVNSIIEEAIDRKASDIHVEPRRGKYLVRFRVDGILQSILDVPQAMESSFVTRIKVMARMDISEHRRPQDGRITLKVGNQDFNLRVNTLPVGDNREKLVMRILRPASDIIEFKDQGMEADDIHKIETLYQAPHGIILVCGPTGSGKTTTLYTILNKINQDIRNISTVEDPVELHIEGLNQSQVNHKADFTFASSMRALLRQDPDVIMVGEIRDLETLEAAIHAALTGHLVFSTIHSNTSAATVTRLIEMGAAPNLISSALMGVVAQRLLRKICGNCRKPYVASTDEKEILFGNRHRPPAEDVTLHRGVGCDLCRNSGFSGRTGVYEVLVVDRELRHMISQSKSDMEVEDTAVASGMKTLTTATRNKILAGITSLDEAVRVLGPTLGGI
jgi:type IV pilus assembly protein PilB